MVESMSIEVVLPTYNGAIYLEEQLRSIYNQTLRPQRVLARDDGSTDGTAELLDQLCKKYGKWLHILPSDVHLGCVGNVNRLLEATTASYVAFADQDDLWYSSKLMSQYTIMSKLEKRKGRNFPILVHSDLDLIDHKGQFLGSSYIKFQRLDPTRTSLSDLTVTNVVTGCSVLINKHILSYALPLPSEAIMHDWWMAMIASCFGEIIFLSNSTVKYRQHSNNTIGAKGSGFSSLLKRIFGSQSKDPEKIIVDITRQSYYFYKRFGINISFLPYIMAMPRFKRMPELISLICQNKLPRKHGILRTVILYVVLIISRQIDEHLIDS